MQDGCTPLCPPPLLASSWNARLQAFTRPQHTGWSQCYLPQVDSPREGSPQWASYVMPSVGYSEVAGTEERGHIRTLVT